MALAYDATQVTRDVDAMFVPHRIVVEEARASPMSWACRRGGSTKQASV